MKLGGIESEIRLVLRDVITALFALGTEQTLVVATAVTKYDNTISIKCTVSRAYYNQCPCCVDLLVVAQPHVVDYISCVELSQLLNHCSCVSGIRSYATITPSLFGEQPG